MSFRTTYVLFGLLIGQIVLFTALQKYGSVPGDDNWVLPKLHRSKAEAKDFTRVEISRTKPKEERVAFERDTETKQWRIVEPFKAKAEDHLVNQLISEIKGVPREEMDLTRDLGEYELAPPGITVTLTRDNGETATLLVGKSGVHHGNRVAFVSSSERPGVALAVRRSAIEQAFKNLKDFRSPHLLAENSPAIASLRLSDGQQELAVKKRSKSKTDLGTWLLEKPAYGEADYDGEPAPPQAEKRKISGVRELLSTVEGIRVQYNPEAKTPVDDFVADNVPAQELADKYGLGAKPATLRIDGEVGLSPFGVGESDPKVKDALLIGNKADEKGEKYYARLESEPNVVRVSAQAVEPLLAIVKDPSPLRNKDLVRGVEEPKIDAIDIQNVGGTIRLRRPKGGEAWKLVEGETVRDADRQTVQGLIGILTLKRNVKGFPGGHDAELGTDKGAAVVSLWQDGIVEDKDKKDSTALKSEVPTVKLTFGNKDKDGKLIYVKREAGTEVARLAVGEDLLDRVNEGRLTYFDRTLPGHPLDEEVVKVTVTRDGKTYEVEKVKKEDSPLAVWKFTQPAELAGRSADEFKVSNIRNGMRGLTPERLVAEKADPAQLADYKLLPPEAKVTLRTSKFDKDKKEDLGKSYDYLFGRPEKPEGGPLYSKQGDRDLIYLAPAQALQLVRHEPVESRIFNFDPAKVQRIKVTAGKQTLEVARKADAPKEWAVQNELPGFVLDSNRLEFVLIELARLSADRFLAFKSGPKAEHGLGDKERRLFIEIDQGDKKDPLTLTLGKAIAEEGGVAAQSSTWPGDVFLVPSAWDELGRDGVEVFNRERKKPEEKKDEKKSTDKKEPAKDDKKPDDKKEPAKEEKKPAKEEKKPEPAPAPKKADSK